MRRRAHSTTCRLVSRSLRWNSALPGERSAKNLASPPLPAATTSCTAGSAAYGGCSTASTSHTSTSGSVRSAHAQCTPPRSSEGRSVSQVPPHCLNASRNVVPPAGGAPTIANCRPASSQRDMASASSASWLTRRSSPSAAATPSTRAPRPTSLPLDWVASWMSPSITGIAAAETSRQVSDTSALPPSRAVRVHASRGLPAHRAAVGTASMPSRGAMPAGGVAAARCTVSVKRGDRTASFFDG